MTVIFFLPSVNVGSSLSVNGGAMIFFLYLHGNFVGHLQRKLVIVIFLLPSVNVGSSSSVNEDVMIYFLSTFSESR